MSNKRHILYVEDDPGSRKVMQFLMTRVEHKPELTIFEDSLNFNIRLEQLSSPPLLFLIDIHVRPLNGFEMLRILRDHPYFHNHMVVALTASVMNGEISQLKAAGFDSVLAKPLSFTTFPQTMSRLLGGERICTVYR